LKNDHWAAGCLATQHLNGTKGMGIVLRRSLTQQGVPADPTRLRFSPFSKSQHGRVGRLSFGVGPQTCKPQEVQESGTHRTWSGRTAPRWDSGISSGLRPRVSALAPRRIPGQRRCSGPALVLQLMVGAPAHGRCSGSWSVLRPLDGAQAHRRCSGTPAMPSQQTKNRRPAPRRSRPNNALELTGKSSRFSQQLTAGVRLRPDQMIYFIRCQKPRYSQLPSSRRQGACRSLPVIATTPRSLGC
jgi:hypothetical protein